MVMRPRPPLAGRWIAGSRSTDAADQILDLGRMRTEVGRHLVEVRIGDLLESRLVDIADDLDADGLQLGSRFMLQGDRLRRLVLIDLVGGYLHPALLLGRKAVPQFVADPGEAVVRLMLSHREYWRNLVMLVREIDVHAIFRHIDH